jgi:hypothetical protein
MAEGYIISIGRSRYKGCMTRFWANLNFLWPRALREGHDQIAHYP